MGIVSCTVHMLGCRLEALLCLLDRAARLQVSLYSLEDADANLEDVLLPPGLETHLFPYET